MTDFKLVRKAEVTVQSDDLSTEDRYVILNWILGEMNGIEADTYANECLYPEQISRIHRRLNP